jgi:hypothetical protein
MPGPRGIITVGSSFQRTYQCKVESYELASTVIASEELEAIMEETVEEALDSNRAVGSFEPAEGVKEVLIEPENSANKKVRVGTTLSSK